jgi:hypothetical protein
MRSKGGRCLWLTTLPTSCAECLEIWESQLSGIIRGVDCLEIWEPQPPRTLRAYPGIALLLWTLKFLNHTSPVHTVTLFPECAFKSTVLTHNVL